jgi:hypothetical protein
VSDHLAAQRIPDRISVPLGGRMTCQEDAPPWRRARAGRARRCPVNRRGHPPLTAVPVRIADRERASTPVSGLRLPAR